VDVRNRDLKENRLMGINIDKFFMPSVANVIGTDLSTYKIVSSNQFACNLMHVGRDEKMPIAILPEGSDPIIVSPAYLVFEIKIGQNLMSQYLMMWFRRTEFDRLAWFYTDADVRGGLDRSALLDITLPIPSIEEQRRVVSEYEALTQRVKINNQLIAKLEDTAQTIYRKMFVDGIDEKHLPEGWRMGTLGDIAEIIDGDRGLNYPNGEDLRDSGYCLFLNASNVTSNGFNFKSNIFISEIKDRLLRKGKLTRGDIVFTTRGSVGNFAYFSDYIVYDNMRINSGMVILRNRSSKDDIMPFIYSILSTANFKNQVECYLSGSAQPQLPIKDMTCIPILIPRYEKIIQYSFMNKKIICYKDVAKNENLILNKMQSLILSELSVI